MKINHVKCEKSQSIGHFYFFAAIIELVRELVNNMQNKVEQDTCPQYADANADAATNDAEIPIAIAHLF